MTSTDGSGRAPQPAAAVRSLHHAAELARDEVVRLGEETRLAVSALSAIGDKARRLRRDSARVAALGLEELPNGDHLAHCIRRLHDALDGARPGRRRLSNIRWHADDVRLQLEKAIDLTATIDIANALDVPFDLITTTQTGARAGLASLTRLDAVLRTFEQRQRTGVRLYLGTAHRPSRPALWLTDGVIRCLPAGSRARYAEEFPAELQGLTGRRAQFVHALRILSRAWALRRALPSAT